MLQERMLVYRILLINYFKNAYKAIIAGIIRYIKLVPHMKGDCYLNYLIH